MATKLTDKVRYNNEVTTIQELDSKGLIEYEKCDNFHSSRTASGLCTKYFANIKGTDWEWEINKTAYLSKTGQKDKIGKVEKLITVDGLEISKDSINAFNKKMDIKANDHWNIAYHRGTLEERRYLMIVANHYGVKKLTSEDVRRYIEREKQK